MPIRLIAIDIDGTLLDSRGRLSSANKAAIRAAVDGGAEVVLATGRQFEFARAVLSELPAVRTIIVSGGAAIKTSDGRTLVRWALARQDAIGILRGTTAFRDITAVLFDREEGGQVVFERMPPDDPRRAYFKRNPRALAEVEPLEACLTEDPLQVAFAGRLSPIQAVMAGLDAIAPAVSFTSTLTAYPAKDLGIVDVTCAGASKGAALAHWARHQGVEAADIMAIGDNVNDREMLALAGVPVVMANGVRELHALGWPITGSNDEGGVASAIETFALSAAR